MLPTPFHLWQRRPLLCWFLWGLSGSERYLERWKDNGLGGSCWAECQWLELCYLRVQILAIDGWRVVTVLGKRSYICYLCYSNHCKLAQWSCDHISKYWMWVEVNTYGFKWMWLMYLNETGIIVTCSLKTDVKAIVAEKQLLPTTRLPKDLPNRLSTINYSTSSLNYLDPKIFQRRVTNSKGVTYWELNQYSFIRALHSRKQVATMPAMTG